MAMQTMTIQLIRPTVSLSTQVSTLRTCQSRSPHNHSFFFPGSHLLSFWVLVPSDMFCTISSLLSFSLYNSSYVCYYYVPLLLSLLQLFFLVMFSFFSKPVLFFFHMFPVYSYSSLAVIALLMLIPFAGLLPVLFLAVHIFVVLVVCCLSPH